MHTFFVCVCIIESACVLYSVCVCVCVCAGLITQIGNVPLLWSRPRNFYLTVVNPVTFLPLSVSV